MTLKEFFESKEKLVIHLPTKEMANKFCERANELGYTWSDKTSYTKYSNYNIYKEETCYSNAYSYSEIDFYKKHDYTILNFNDIEDFKENDDMENYIVINGKKAELTEEQIKQLGIDIPKENYNPFEKPKKGEEYYFIDELGIIDRYTWCNDSSDISFYNISNCCKNKELMKQRALHETLNRLLWRFTYENGWDDTFIYNFRKTKWYIRYDRSSGNFSKGCNLYLLYQGAIYFKDKETAQKAIDEIVKPFMKEHPDFVW